MRLTIERATLLKSLNHVQSVVERRNTIPILSNVLLSANAGKLSLSSTDLEIEVVEEIDAEVSDNGATTAPAHMLYDIVRKLPEGSQLELEKGADESRLLVNAGKSKFTLQSLPSDDFPDLGSGDMSHKFTIGSAELKRLIDKTRFAISTEETRYYLNGIYFHEAVEAGSPVLRAVATDGHRLAQVQYALPDGAAGMPGVIIPRKAVLELHRLIEDEEGNVEISLSDSKIKFQLGSLVLTTKLIDGSFPDYTRVIPENNDKVLGVDAKAFTASVDRVSTITSEKGRAVKMDVEASQIVLSVNNPESGSAREELGVSYDGSSLEIGFNAKYLIDITSQIESDSAEFLFADAGSPTIIRASDDETSLYVLMPMRV